MNVYVETFEKKKLLDNAVKKVKVTGNNDGWFLDEYLNNSSMQKDQILAIEQEESFNIWDEQWELGTIEQNGDLSSVTNAIRTKNYIPVLPNTVYYINTGRWRDIHCYDGSFQHLGVTPYTASGSGYTFTTLSGAQYIKVPFTAAYGTVYKYDICINKTQIDTSIWPYNGCYVPYQGIEANGEIFPKYLLAKKNFTGNMNWPIMVDSTYTWQNAEYLKYITRDSNTVRENIAFTIVNGYLNATFNGEIGLKLVNNKTNEEETVWVISKNGQVHFSPFSVSDGKMIFDPRRAYNAYYFEKNDTVLNPMIMDGETVGSFELDPDKTHTHTAYDPHAGDYDYIGTITTQLMWESSTYETRTYDIVISNIRLTQYYPDDDPGPIQELINKGIVNFGGLYPDINISPAIPLYYYDSEWKYIEATQGYIQLNSATSLTYNSYYEQKRTVFYVANSDLESHQYKRFNPKTKSIEGYAWVEDGEWVPFTSSAVLKQVEDSVYYDFVTQGVISDYVALQWQDGYNTVGTFSLIIEDTDKNRELFKPDRYLFIEKSDKVMIIEKVKFNANLMSDGYLLEVSGRSLESILERRVAFPGIGLNTNICKSEKGLIHALYMLVHNYFIDPREASAQSSDGETMFYYPERIIPFMDDSFTDYEENGYYSADEYIKRPFKNSINKTVIKDNLLKVIQEQCQASNLGFKIIPHKVEDGPGYVWRFILYTGDDRSYSRADKTTPLMVFSPKLNNVSAVATTEDDTNYRNVVFCGTERDCDTYIDFTSLVFEKYGFDLKLPKVISGLKEQAIAKLTESPPCYTGILYLALAAARTDKSYNATVVDVSGLDGVLRENFSITGRYGSEAIIKSENIPYMNSSAIDEYTQTENAEPETHDFVFTYNKRLIVPIGVGIIDGETPSNNEYYAFWLGINAQEVDASEDNHFVFISNTRNESLTQGLPLNVYYQSEEWMDGNKDLNIIVNNYQIRTGVSGETYEDDPVYLFDQLFKYWYYKEGLPSPYNPTYLTLFTDNAGIEMRKICIVPVGYTWNQYTQLSDAARAEVKARIIYAGSLNGNPNSDSKYFGNVSLKSDRNYDNRNDLQKGTNTYGYISKAQADKITVTYKITYGDENTSNAKTASFQLSNVNDAGGFKASTGTGWLTTNILNQAIQDLNDSEWGDDGIVNGVIKNAEKWAVSLWFKSLDAYTKNSGLKRWLCQTYISNSEETGLNRREIFVEEEKDEGDDWNASAIAQWAANTTVVKTDDADDEDSDENVNDRLKESARKQAGNYRKQRDVDADVQTIDLEYLGDGPKGYHLGDIVQVDDGRGNMEKKIIASVTIADDTSSGFKAVPTFTEYTLIPKDYKQLDWIQVANMILPAEFNPQSGISSETDDGQFPLTNYGGTNKQEEDDENFIPKYIKTIYNESVGKVTNIEMKMSYTPKPGLTVENLTDTFSIISTIGYLEKDQYDFGYYIPFMLSISKNKCFTNYDLREVSGDHDYRIDEEGLRDDNYHMLFRLGESINTNPSLIISRFLGLGYTYNPNISTNSNSIFINDSFYQYTYTHSTDKTLKINEIIEDYMLLSNAEIPGISNDKKKKVLYSKSMVDNYTLMKRPQIDKYLLSKYSLPTGSKFSMFNVSPGYSWDLGDKSILLNAIGYINDGYSYTIYPMKQKGNRYTISDEFGRTCLQTAYNNKHVKLYGNKNYGQLYYNYMSPLFYYGDSPIESIYFDENNKPVIPETYNLSEKTRITTHSPKRKNIILGGYAFYYNDDGYMYFSGNISPIRPDPSRVGELTDPDYPAYYFTDEDYSDIQNGVRVYSIDVYEYNSSNRLYQYQPDEPFNPDNPYGDVSSIKAISYAYENRALDGYNKVTGTAANDTNGSLINSENPDLSSRRLVHQYIPVEYIGGNKDEMDDDAERFGLYDTVEQMFVPVNWKWVNIDGSSSKNDQAVLVAYGGHTDNI